MATVKAIINGAESTVENVKNASGTVLATLSAEVATQTKEITANGTYAPDSGYDGFSSINVNVPSSGGGSFASGSFTPSEATYTQTIETGLSEVKGFAVCINKDVSAQSVRTLCAVIADVTNGFKFFEGSNGSGSTLFSGGRMDVFSATTYLTVSVDGGNISITSKDTGCCGYFVPTTYYWYAW